MTKGKAVERFDEVVRQHGAVCLNFTWLKDHGMIQAYNYSRRWDVGLRQVAMYYGIADEWDDIFGSVSQIWRDWEACFAEHGMQSLSCAWLKEHGMLRLYTRAQMFRLTIGFIKPKNTKIAPLKIGSLGVGIISTELCANILDH